MWAKFPHRPPETSCSHVLVCLEMAWKILIEVICLVICHLFRFFFSCWGKPPKTKQKTVGHSAFLKPRTFLFIILKWEEPQPGVHIANIC